MPAFRTQAPSAGANTTWVFVKLSMEAFVFAFIFTFKAKPHNSGCGNVKSLGGPRSFDQFTVPPAIREAEGRNISIWTAGGLLLPGLET